MLTHRLTIPYWHVLPVLLLSAAGIHTASAQIFRINPENPGSFNQVEQALQQIEQDLGSAQCGGWDIEIPVAGEFSQANPEGKIANVQNLPGRGSNPLGNVESGMAERIEQGGVEGTGFNFPDSTAGFQTLCRPATNEYLDPQRPYRVNASFFCEHPCQRPLDGIKPQNSSDGYANCGNQVPNEDGIKYSCGGGEMKAPGEDIRTELINNGQGGGLCEDLNRWAYSLQNLFLWTCLKPVPGGPPIPVDFYAWKKTACDREDLLSTDSEPGPDGFGDWQFVGKYECCSDKQLGNQKNCTICTGQECRLNPNAERVVYNDVWVEAIPPGFPDITVAPGEFPNDIPNCPTVSEDYRKIIYGRNYKSYFREYPDATFTRDTVDEHVEDDSGYREEIPAACYGIYEVEKPGPPTGAPLTQEDAKVKFIENKEKRCVIAAYYEELDANFWEMKDTQLGKGEYGQNSNIPDDPFNDGPRDPDFDPSADLWYQNLGGGFSMLNDPLYKEYFEDDLTFALLAPDSAKLRASGQTINGSGQLISSGALLRAFDDTVANEDGTIRTVIEWWQDLQTEMHKRLSPPIVRLLLPAAWSIDLDPLDPLYTPDIPDPNSVPEVVDTKLQPIEVQIQAGEGALGDVVAFMIRSQILRIEEKPIQVMVPLASATELRAYAHGWENWKKIRQENNQSVSPEVDTLIGKLHQYANYTDQVRQLRAELPHYTGKLLSKQKEMTDALAKWLVENVDAYQSYLDQREQLNGLRSLWEDIQGTYVRFHDIETFPWCRNDRFTTPIYSLLDPWLLGRGDPDDFGDLRGNEEFGECTRDGGDIFACAGEHGWGLPFLDVLLEDNIEADFTAFSSGSGAIILPVLKPVQVRMSVSQLQPPTLPSSDPGEIPELPDLPDIPTIFEDVEDSFPDVTVTQPPPIITPPELNPTNVELVLLLSRYIIEEMTKEYKLFWDAAVDEPKEGTEQDCLDPHTKNCIHAEMDLRERLQRWAARPAVFLQEDFDSTGQPIDRLKVPYTECPTEDWVCHILHSTKRWQREGWQTKLVNPDEYEEQFDELLNRVRDESDTLEPNTDDPRLPLDIQENTILPNFRNPPDVELIPVYQGSSSSS